MPMTEQLPGLSATRSAFLELEDERRFVQEGYEFLDEKRMLLAAELLRQLEHYKQVYARYSRVNEQAIGELKRAIYRHGLDGLAVYPPLELANPRVELEQTTFLGVTLQQVQADLEGPGFQWAAVNPSPEANSCAASFRLLLGIGMQLATVSGNLHRLCNEYMRTEHRARALEKVIIPEIDATLRMIDERLETIDQEDVLRVRFRKQQPSRPVARS
jgi:V/A-type H+-transporting ATPase subunit D